jgi:hypothetical protein
MFVIELSYKYSWKLKFYNYNNILSLQWDYIHLQVPIGITSNTQVGARSQRYRKGDSRRLPRKETGGDPAWGESIFGAGGVGG